MSLHSGTTGRSPVISTADPRRAVPAWLALALWLVLLLSGLLGTDAGLRDAAAAADQTVFLPLLTTPIGIQRAPFATGFDGLVTDIQNAGDNRLFVVERLGRIRLVDGSGSVAATPFLDISAQVEAGFVEQGLLGLAFHPDYASNGRLFVTYTDETGEVVLSRFTVSGTDPNQADPDSEVILLTITQQNVSHQGGALAFGPDGLLYVGAGDGGYGTYVDYAIDPAFLVGKILRLDVDSGTPYAIPPDNPFVGATGAREEVFAVGLRNPWRISFDSATGDLWIGDVGEATWEEVNLIEAGSAGGENLGWRCYEGYEAFNLDGCDSGAVYDFPVFAYAHEGGKCAVTGGAVYRGALFPRLTGLYIYADFCTGQSFGLLQDEAGRFRDLLLGDIGNAITTFGADAAGELYFADGSTGILYRVETVP